MLDEAHRAKSYRVDKPEASSQMAQAVPLLQESCPNARVVYASATGLQSLESMAYASRLLLWGGANAAFPTFQDFSAKFLKKVSKVSLLLAMSSVLRGRPSPYTISNTTTTRGTSPSSSCWPSS